MIRTWHSYDKWECYRAGMHSSHSPTDPTAAYQKVLGDEELFAKAMRRVFLEWPRSCEHFLSNESSNRIAWLGQAAVCIETGVGRKYRSEFLKLTQQQQDNANKIAAKAIKEWSREYDCRNSGVRGDVEGKGLFD